MKKKTVLRMMIRAAVLVVVVSCREAPRSDERETRGASPMDTAVAEPSPPLPDTIMARDTAEAR